MKTFTYLIFLLSHSLLLAQNFDLKSGDGTFYDSIAGTASGNCGIFIEADDFNYCALNTIDYNNAKACGGYIEVFGRLGSVILQVVDRCPECAEGDVDMTEQAFSEIDLPINGRVPISWKFIESPKTENVLIKFKDGSSKYHVEVQLSQIRYPIVGLEYLGKDGQWVAMERQLYNFFVEPKGIDSPMTLRSTSITGEQLVFENINLVVGNQTTNQQFAKVDESFLSIADVNHIVAPQIQVYPNPFGAELNITGNPLLPWELYDSQGRVVRKGSEFPIQQNLQTLESGNYYLLLTSSKKVYKIVK